MACRLLRERLVQLWPDLTRQSVLGLGYASPYLRAWQGQAERCIAAVPAQVGMARWPTVHPNLACTVDQDALPFPDLVFDTVIPRNVRVGEAPSFGRPVIHHDPPCSGADAYFELAKEVAARG